MNDISKTIRVDRPIFPDNQFDIREFGGIGDGKAYNTDAFRRGIDVCAKKGGTLHIPAGKYFTGPVHFKSNVNIHLADGAEILFSGKFDDALPPVFSRWEGIECWNYSPMIYGIDCENIAITGKGTIYGGGEPWWPWKKMQDSAAKRLYHAEHDGIPVDKRVFANEKDALRPYFVQLIRCRNILFEGVTFTNGPMWTISPVYCENVLFRELSIITNGPNTDGINPESSKNVIIEHCTFNTGDDCIAINSGMNEDGWRVGKTCENIVIRNCVMRGGHACIAIGSGVSGGIRNIHVHDCDFTGGGERGIRIKTMPGRGGFVQDVVYENLVISDKVRNAIEITAFYPSSSAPSASGTLTRIENISFRNITGKDNRNVMDIDGTPDNHLVNIQFRDIDLAGETGMKIRNTDGIVMENVTISAEKRFAKE